MDPQRISLAMYSGSERPTHRESQGSVFRERETDPHRVSGVCIQAAREIGPTENLEAMYSGSERPTHRRVSRVCIQAARDRPTVSLKGLYSGCERDKHTGNLEGLYLRLRERDRHTESLKGLYSGSEMTDPQRVSRVCIQAAREINTQRISRVCIQAA